MTSSAAAPERESRMRNSVREDASPQPRIITGPEVKKLKKGMSARTKVLLATVLALGATAVGGVIAKQKFDALPYDQKLDFANSAIGKTNWFPWLSGRIRAMRDAGIMAELQNPNPKLTPLERLSLANRIIATTGDSPDVQSAVRAHRDATLRRQAEHLSTQASNLFGSLGRRLGLGGGGVEQLTQDVHRTNKLVQDSGMYSATPDRPLPGAVPVPRTETLPIPKVEPKIVPPPKVVPPPVDIPGM